MIFISIKCIYFYRKIAPKSIRNSCLFIPSCSEYAILSLKKYGFIKGWNMALKRIFKCKQPNGGIDFP